MELLVGTELASVSVTLYWTWVGNLMNVGALAETTQHN